MTLSQLPKTYWNCIRPHQGADWEYVVFVTPAVVR